MVNEIRILNNKTKGTVVEVLKNNLTELSTVSCVSSQFSIYAYNELRKSLKQVKEFNLLIPGNDSIKALKNSLIGQVSDTSYRNLLDSKSIAKDCYEWCKKNVGIKHYNDKVEQTSLHGANKQAL